MEAATHAHAVESELNPATWRDPKRYAWLLGLIVPLLPFIAWGYVELTGLGVFWCFGPFLVFGVFPLLDVAIGMDAENPPDSVIKWLEQDRYYRWCTYLFIPRPVRRPRLRLLAVGLRRPLDRRQDRARVTMAMVSGIAINTAHELGHKRAYARALAEQGRARAERLRPLLHRAQPRPPRPRRDPRGPGQRPARRELLGVPAAHRRGQPGVSTWGWSGPASTQRPPAWSVHNDILQAWAMTVVLFAALTAVFGWAVLPYLLVQAVLGFSLLEVVNYLEHYGLLRQKREDGRYERCRARAQLEQQQRRLQRAALPPAAPQRPPRQPDPPLPGAAPRRRSAAAADRLRGDDPCSPSSRRSGGGSWTIACSSTTAATSPGEHPAAGRAPGAGALRQRP